MSRETEDADFALLKDYIEQEKHQYGGDRLLQNAIIDLLRHNANWSGVNVHSTERIEGYLRKIAKILRLLLDDHLSTEDIVRRALGI